MPVLLPLVLGAVLSAQTDTSTASDQLPFNDEQLDWLDYLGELNVTLKGLVLCCRQALPIFRRRGGGKIVNLSTIYVDNPVKGQSKYITAKSAVVGYSRALAREVAAENIQVNVLSPNMTQTDRLNPAPESQAYAQSRTARNAGQACPRLRQKENSSVRLATSIDKALPLC